jgi:hypothetical protein
LSNLLSPFFSADGSKAQCNITSDLQKIFFISNFSSHLISKNLKIKIYKTVILPVALYGCETWSLTLREEHRLRVVEKRMLRRLFGPKRVEDES